MTVVVVQLRDGVAGDEIVIVPKVPESDRETLARKIASAKRYGWEFEQASPDELHTWKEYEEGPVRRKDRYFRIEA